MTNNSTSPPETTKPFFIQAVHAMSTVCGWVAAAMILASVLITCQMIFSRFVLHQSTIWQTELVVYLMVGATCVGLSYVQLLRGHVNVDLLPLMLPIAARRTLAFITLTCAVLIIALILFYGIEFWYEVWKKGWKSDTVWAVRLWIPYLAVPVGFGFFLLQLIADITSLALNLDTPFHIKEQ